MLSFIFKIAFMFILILPPSYAEICSPEELESELIKLQLDPEIKTNDAFLSAIEFKYGEYAKDFLIQSHSYLLENEKGPIDKETIVWSNEVIWDKRNPLGVYLYVAGDLQTDAAIDYFVLMLDAVLFSKRKTIPLFQYNNSAVVYKDLLKPGNEHILRESYKRLFPTDSDERLDLAVKIFIHHFRKLDDYNVGFDDFEAESKPVILVAGHSRAGLPSYVLGDKSISADQIVQNLVDMGIPRKANLKLVGCFTACKKGTITHTVKEIEQLFFQERLLEIYDDQQTESFANIFVRALKRRMPTYSGRVDAYIGEVAHAIGTNILTLSGKRTTAFYVKIKAIDGDVRLKRMQASIFYDFSKSK